MSKFDLLNQVFPLLNYSFLCYLVFYLVTLYTCKTSTGKLTDVNSEKTFLGFPNTAITYPQHLGLDSIQYKSLILCVATDCNCCIVFLGKLD